MGIGRLNACQSCDQAGSRMCCNILAGTVSKTKMGIGWLNACQSCDQAGSRMCCNILAGTVSKTKMVE